MLFYIICHWISLIIILLLIMQAIWRVQPSMSRTYSAWRGGATPRAILLQMWRWIMQNSRNKTGNIKNELCEVPEETGLPYEESEVVNQLLTLLHYRLIVNSLIWLPGLCYLYSYLFRDYLEQKQTFLSMASNGIMKFLVSQSTFLVGILLPISFVWTNKHYLEVRIIQHFAFIIFNFISVFYHRHSSLFVG